MSTIQPQAVAGVSASSESEIMTVFPSIGATWLGKSLGKLYDAVPVPVLSTSLSRLMFPLPTAPLAAMTYMVMKANGTRYRLTNRSVQKWSSIGEVLKASVALKDVVEIRTEHQEGQAFFRCSDLILTDASGKKLMTLEGVPRAEVFRQTILKARDARIQVESALAAIDAR